MKLSKRQLKKIIRQVILENMDYQIDWDQEGYNAFDPTVDANMAAPNDPNLDFHAWLDGWERARNDMETHHGEDV